LRGEVKHDRAGINGIALDDSWPYQVRCDAYTYSSLIIACVNAGDAKRGLQLYVNMARASPPVARTVVVYTAGAYTRPLLSST
jgi:pentatricopeptide repeat protein